ncbi:MAG: UDP-N-acetylmuramate--L-alanine ligase [Planctomycetota bacterium]
MSPTAVAPKPLHTGPCVIPPDFERRHLHLVGIGGCGMSALAALLLRRGTRLSGSDAQTSGELERLGAAGAKIIRHGAAGEIPSETALVVASAAIPADHAELTEARRRGLPVVKYAELLGAVMDRCEGIAISGTHGKSTTTAWLAFVLREAGLDPSFVVGATVPQLGGGSGVGHGRHFVAEACEYDRSFLHLRPRRAAILNIEEDHLDCYRDLAEIREAFATFGRGVAPDGLIVLNADDARCQSLVPELGCGVQTVGTCAPADWQPANLALSDGRYAFDVVHGGAALGRLHPRLAGRHTVGNALVVAALAHDCGVPWDTVQAGIEAFEGARRRLELRGEVGGLRVLDDYAHHPTEIRATLQAARERYNPQRLWCVFQPHQHSRTRFLLADFARSFALADHVLVPDIYFVRDSERERERVRAEDLVARIRAGGGDAAYLPAFDAIVERLACDARPGDVVLTMGAGNIWKVADGLVQRLRAHLPD